MCFTVVLGLQVHEMDWLSGVSIQGVLVKHDIEPSARMMEESLNQMDKY